MASSGQGISGVEQKVLQQPAKEQGCSDAPRIKYLVNAQPDGSVVQVFRKFGVRCVHEVGLEPSK